MIGANADNAGDGAVANGGAAAGKKQELFGGAFHIEKFPATLRDISDIVPIEDN